MAVNRCPRCGLVNPASAQKCDCGYSFADGTLGAPLQLRSAPPRGVNSPMIAIGIILIAAGLVVSLLTMYMASKGGGGRVLVAYGPIVVGVGMLIRGLTSRG